MAVEPVAALRRIAFLLERRMADSYRIKAYRNAAAALLRLDADEVRSRAAAGTLRDLPGIGAKTAAIVSECLAGRVPAYLTELESSSGPLAERGTGHRRALRGDLHSHSDWSDGGSPIEEMAMTAIELGHEYLVLTDHSPRLRVANGLSSARLTRQLEVVAALNEHLSPGPAPAPAPAATAITADVDVYRQPGGVGEPYGVARAGTTVKVLQRHDDNWVQVQGDGIPGGSGWVWGDFVG